MNYCLKCGKKINSKKEFCNSICKIAYNLTVENENYLKRDTSGDFKW